MPPNEVFPALQSCTKLTTSTKEACTAYDVKFYPFGTIDDDQIFAVAAERDVFVCRPHLGPEKSFETLRWFRDENPEASANSVAWARNPTTGKPWLCIAGTKPRHIKILDIESAEAARTLSGHGKGVNDLAISPLSSSLLASCAEDTTIRLWNLEPAYEKRPCVALFAGEGHKWPVMAVHFHPNGRWLLSGGQDTAVCLWAVPTLEELDKNGTTRHEPITVYYPHFFSKELHPNYVDSLAFYGDLVISRSARDQNDRSKVNNILIWKIDGFESDKPTPAQPPIPVHGEQTRSSFPHDTEGRFRGFQRLVTLDMPHTDRFYYRFGFFNQPGKRPVLAMGSHTSAMSFWDLQRLEEGLDPRDKLKGRKGRGKTAASARSGSLATSTSTPDSTPAPADRDFSDLEDRLKHVDPHHRVVVNTGLSPTQHFSTSQIEFSPDGTWMVSVGDRGMMCIWHRDRALCEWGALAGKWV